MQGFDDLTDRYQLEYEDKQLHSKENGKLDPYYVPELKFHVNNVFSFKNNPISGIALPQWIMILTKYYRHIEFRYIPRVIVITLLSIFNYILSKIENFLYAEKIKSVQIPDDPIFIIGHPRTGTTLVHNLLGADHFSFYYASTFCVGFPSCFLFFEEFGKNLFANVIEKTRPMDSMPLHFELPQEDEVATNILSGGVSYYMPLYFMQQEKELRRYLDFSKADGGEQQDEEQWATAFIYFFKKVCLREELLRGKPNNKRLVIKSPVHTARVPLLRKMFPHAKFIYLHRHPDTVIKSAAKMADTAYWFCYLNTPSNQQISDFIYWQFKALWQKYNAAVYHPVDDNICNNTDRSAGLSKDVIEVAYSDLTTAPLDTLRRIYSFLEVPFTDKQQQIFTKELVGLKDYKTNKFTDLNRTLQAINRLHFKEYFDAFGYK